MHLHYFFYQKISQYPFQIIIAIKKIRLGVLRLCVSLIYLLQIGKNSKDFLSSFMEINHFNTEARNKFSGFLLVVVK